MELLHKIQEVVNGLNKSEADYLKSQGYTSVAFFTENGDLQDSYKWNIKEKTKYINIDCGGSGAFLVDKVTGEIYNIKGYGVADKNKKAKADLGNIWDVDPAFLHSRRWNYLNRR